MNNVFDLIAEFYNQDEEWDNVFCRCHVENYLRAKAWNGASDEQLTEYWNKITMFCLYLGNSENFLGDMSADDFIDCAAWCGRNISEFTVSEEYIASFFDVMIDMYQYLYSKKIVNNASAPVKAKEKLLCDGKIIMFDENGVFYPKYDAYNKQATEDLPAKIFLDIGSRMQNLVSFLTNFFMDKKYAKDIERAVYLYSGIFLSGSLTEKPGTEEYAQCFWDYFLFDYVMIDEDEHPIKYFAQQVYSGKLGKDALANKDVLDELLKAELVLFYIEDVNEDGLYICKNFLTGETYNLLLPIEGDMDISQQLFLGHIFYNKSMVMNFVRGIYISKAAQKRLYSVIVKAKEWMAMRNHGELSWDTFINRNTMFLRHISLMFAAYVKLDSFNHTTNVQDYQPAAIDEQDKVCGFLKNFMSVYNFTKYDIELAQTMWSDYKELSGKEVKLGELWAAAVIYNFITANAVYNYDIDKVSEMCRNVPTSAIKKAADEIKQVLKLEKHDPRYINEEGLLLMLLS